MLGATPDEDLGVAVRGHLWEVDLLKRRLKCSYWPDSQHRVVRGTWYIDRGSGYAPLKVGRRCQWWGPIVVHPVPSSQGAQTQQRAVGLHVHPRRWVGAAAGHGPGDCTSLAS